MISDSNSVVDFATNVVVGLTGGDMVLLGFIMFALVIAILLLSRVKASTAVMVGVGVAFMFAFVAGAFMIVFWIALIASLFVLINGLRKWITGQ